MKRVFIATGDDIVRATLSDHRLGDVERVVGGAGALRVALDPADPAHVYAATFDDGLLVSGDGGASWAPPEQGPNEGRVMSVAVSGSVAYAGTEPSNLYRASDGGRVWELLPALREIPSEPQWSFPPRPYTHHVSTIAPHPTNRDALFVGIELGGVMRTFDGGETWADHNPQAHSDAHRLRTHSLAPDRVYEVAGQGIALSDDRGARWRRLEGGLDRHYAWAITIDPADPDLWYVSVSRGPFAAHGAGDGESVLLRSGPDGWSRIDTWGNSPELRRMPYALATLPEQPGSLLVGLRGGTLLLSDDRGESWARLEVELPDVVDLTVAPA
jgi:photosystem II stability/assembly factor-like uncharacterized protein